jgi:hypothetical protein
MPRPKVPIEHGLNTLEQRNVDDVRVLVLESNTPPPEMTDVKFIAENVEQRVLGQSDTRLMVHFVR